MATARLRLLHRRPRLLLRRSLRASEVVSVADAATVIVQRASRKTSSSAERLARRQRRKRSTRRRPTRAVAVARATLRAQSPQQANAKLPTPVADVLTTTSCRRRVRSLSKTASPVVSTRT